MLDFDHPEDEFDVLRWINEYESDVRCLCEGEIKRVMYFTLLWGIFEKKICRNNASVKCFREEVIKWKAERIIEIEKFLPYLEYFKSRYIFKGKPNCIFRKLCLRNRTDNPDRVISVLMGCNDDDVDIVVTILTIVWRYRCNLFHGIKRIHDIREQKENFNVANRILACALTLNDKL